MGQEVTTTAANDLLFDEWVSSEVLIEARPLFVHRPFFAFASNQHSNVYRWPIQDDPGAASAKNEASDLTNTALTTSKGTATLGTVGIMATVTDELVYAAVADPRAHFSGVLGRSVAEKFENDAAALTDSGSASNGTPVSSVDDLLAAQAALLARDTSGFGPLVAVMGINKSSLIQRDIVNSGGSYWANPGAAVGGADMASQAGFFGAPLGIPCYRTSALSTDQGTLFVVGQFIGMYEAWAPKSETFRDISNVATELVTTQRYGVAELRDSFGQDIS